MPDLHKIQSIQAVHVNSKFNGPHVNDIREIFWVGRCTTQRFQNARLYRLEEGQNARLNDNENRVQGNGKMTENTRSC